jgi:hypothetical protein
MRDLLNGDQGVSVMIDALLVINARIVSKPSLTRLGKSCPLFGRNSQQQASTVVDDASGTASLHDSGAVHFLA